MEEKFNYEYSARQNEEIKKIRDKYEDKSETKMQKLIALDKSVTKTGRTVALIIGVVSVMLLGIGMCMCMVFDMFIMGIIIGIVGIAGISATYPIYKTICEYKRKKIAPEILELSDELLNGK